MKPRTAFTLSAAEVCSSLQLLTLKASAGPHLLKYSDCDFKKAPRWNEAKHFLNIVDSLLIKSGGRQILHSLARTGVQKYINDNNLSKYNSDEAENTAYKLRAVIGQLTNHLAKDI